MSRFLFPLVVMSALVACKGDKADDTSSESDADADSDADSDADADADADSDADSDADADADPATFTVEGNAVNFASFEPVAAGLCIDALDPTNVLSGGAPEVMASATIGEGGAFSIPGVYAPSLGMLLAVHDCGSEGTVFPSATGVPSSAYADVADGGVVSGRTALSVDTPTKEFMEASFEAAGSAMADLDTYGVATGFIWDSTGMPISGATITCGACVAYYADRDPSDGIFTTGSEVNTSTNADAAALWAVPGATLTTYQPAADGYTFNSSPLAGLPGYAVIAVFQASGG